MPDTNDDDTSSYTVGGSKEGGTVKARWSFNAGDWQKGMHIEEDEEEQEEVVKARWSFNAGAAASLLPEDFDENEVWSPTTTTKKTMVSVIQEEEETDTNLSLSINDLSLGDPSERSHESPITPSKSPKEEKKMGSPTRRYIPNPVIPRIPTETSKTDDDDFPEPKRMYMELCGETCEKEFRDMTLEAHSLSPRVQKKEISQTEILRLSLSATGRKRPSVQGALKKQKNRSMERKNYIRDSLRNLDC